MEPVTVLDQDLVRDDVLTNVRDIRERGSLDLATRHMRGVSSLLSTRDDLRGVHAFADVVEESVRWSA
jgi:hypothetical protein